MIGRSNNEQTSANVTAEAIHALTNACSNARHSSAHD